MKKTKQFLFFVMFWAMLSQIAWAQLTVTKTELNGITSINAGTPFTYVIEYSTPSTTEFFTNLTICDQIPQGLTFLGVSAPTSDMTSLAYDSGTNTVCANFVSPWNGGTGQFQIVVRFDNIATFDGTVTSNVATIASDQTSFTTSPPVVVTAINPTQPMPVLTTGTSIVKNGNNSVSDGQLLTYYLDYGIGGQEAVPNLTITDQLPSGFILTSIAGGVYSGTNLPYNIYYQTNLNATWTLFPGSPFNTGTWTDAMVPTFPAGEYVTQIEVRYTNLPAGPLFTKENLRKLSLQGYFDNSIAGLTDGQTFQNCASCVGDGVGAGTSSSCQTTTYTNTPSLVVGFGKHKAGWEEDVEVGGIYTYVIQVGEGNENGADIVNPVVSDLLPPEFIFVGNVVIVDKDGTAYADAGSPAPQFEIIPNYAGTGRTLLRWTWDTTNPFTIVRQGGIVQIVDIKFDIQIRSAPTGGYQNDAYLDTEGTPVYCGSYNQNNDDIVDVNDFDGDGNTTETLCHTYVPVNIINPSGAALLAEKWVKGSLDAAYSRFPDIGHTTPGGIADYQLKLINAGNVDMTDIVVIDILPYVGDAGVIDLSPRGTEWQPYLVGPVTVPAGITVYYSTSPNPCRTELNYPVAGCDAAPNWTTTPPADITTVRSLKLDFGSIVMQPAEEILIEWPMRAPIDAPDNGEIAWNSFGYTVSRADNGDILPPSEPLKVGIAIEPIQPAVYGDYVWFDSNHNGIQDEPASQGLNGVTVELYADTNGNGIAEPGAGDNLVSFTVTNTFNGNPGYYLFPNLPPGNYFAVFYVPNGYNVSNSDQGTDDALDSDGTAGTVSGQSVMITPVTNLIATEDDRTWDLGVYCTTPTATVSTTSPTCNGATSNNDGIVEITATDGTKYGFSIGTTYTGPNFASATNVGALPIVIANNAAPAAQYTVRVYSGDGSCYYDQTVTLPTPSCNAPCSVTVDSAVPTACNPATNTYDLAVTVSYANQPTGDITINVGGTDYTFTPDGTSPDTYTVTGLASDGAIGVDVTATFVGDNACTDVLVDAYNAPASCTSLCNLTSAGLAGVMCNNAGTNADATDDYINFTLNPTGSTLGAGYVVTVSSGSVTPNTGTYGAATNFQLQAGSAGSGDIIVTITDNVDSNCKVQVTITDTGSCSTPTCPPAVCVPIGITKN